MVYGYCRVSSRGQISGTSLKDQTERILELYPEATIKKETQSAAIKRPVLEKIINDSKKGDTIVVTKLDRFCRSTREGLDYIDRLQERGVRLHILNMGLVDDTPIGRMISTNLLAYAEFERAMIIERIQAGKAIAKTKPGYHEGRPKKFTPEQERLALSLLKDHSYNQVVEMTGISRATLYRIKAYADALNIKEANKTKKQE